MLFNSVLFVLFLPAVVLLARSRASWRTRKAGLLLASFAFYAAWSPAFVLLIWLSTLVDWQVGLKLGKTKAPAARRTLALISLLLNLGLLGVFKYGNFLIENTIAVFGAMGIVFQPLELRLLLPVGISFYTFQTLSYTLDVFRGRLEPRRSLLDFALYVSFFPQLVAGPIVRASGFLPQLEKEQRATGDQMRWGFTLMVIGLFQKVVLADQIMAFVVDRVYLPSATPGAMEAWTGTIAFAAQIFFDFSGYSLCAIGAGMLLGFKLPDNFRRPYGAIGFSDFWRRWHISLSTWLRDYLYISLGGNRRGPVRTYVNLAITMLLGGLWHGASWNFVIWGALHGLYLVVERLLRPVLTAWGWTKTTLARFFSGALTYALVCLAWVFFRAADLGSALSLVGAMFGLGDGGRAMRTEYWAALAISLLLCVAHAVGRNTDWETVGRRVPTKVAVPLLAIMLFLVAISGDARAFIYFQF